MKVTVVIPSLYGVTDGYADLCMDSLLKTTDWPIIRVVNGAPMDDVDYAVRVTTIWDRRQGQCFAVNMGVRASDADWVLVSNDDMYYAPGWNKNLVFYGPCFSPNLIEPTDNNGSAPPFLKFNGGLTLGTFNQKEVDQFVKTLVEESVSSKTETGFNLPVFINKDLWNLIGGYDDKYDPWGSNSDTDLQTKIELAGVQPMRLRDVLVYHFSNKSGTFDGSHQEAWQRNWNLYKDKWGFTRDDEPIPDTWYARDLVNKEKNIYHPDWEGKYNATN